MTKTKFLAAALISPWAAPVIVVVVSGTWSFQDYDPLFLFVVTIAVVVSYVGFFAIGLPLIYILRRAGWLNFPTLVVGGALAGIVVFFFFTKVFGFSSASFDVPPLVLGAAFGCGVACTFGLIAGIPFRRSVPRVPAPP